MGSRFLIIVFLIIALIFFGFVLKNREVKGSLFGSLLYVLAMGLLLGAGALIGNQSWLPIPYHLVYISLGVWMLLFGVLHVLFLYKLLPWVTTKVTELKFCLLY